MKKLLLRCGLSPGDIVMLTAAVRDLHRCYPGRFLTGVRTTCMELWENNPHVVALEENLEDVEVIDCAYPLINECDGLPYHCLHGFIEFLNQKLGLQIRPTAFKGDIHLSRQEKAWFSQVHELAGEDSPFWLVSAGGKYDATVKWWSTERFQRVVDHFRGRLAFVQVGQRGHHHPKLEGAIDLRGRTTLRQLVRLVYHAEGVLGPITCLMHLAAAVESKRHPTLLRPCVVVAGGREPSHWEAYPGHQFIDTIGALSCCARSGCWRDRTRPLGDGDERDRPEHLCVAVANQLPRCMDLISAEDVIERIDRYYRGGTRHYLEPEQWRGVRKAIRATRNNPFSRLPLTVGSARLECERFMAGLSAGPPPCRGRGIVMCAGGARYFTNAWVAIRLLRQHGCRLPIEVWHLDSRELTGEMRGLLEPLGVRCIDAAEQRKTAPCRRLGGWELKAYAVAQSAFEQVLFLDADNMAVADPSYLFDLPEFRETGAVFWPDLGQLGPTQRAWDLLGVQRPEHPEFESGQMLFDKARCWKPLRLALWINEHSDFFYQFLHGDKETYHLAFQKLNQPFTRIPFPVTTLRGTMCQQDPAGRRLFQHRNTDKWTLFGLNPSVEDFWFETDCRRFLAELRQCWDGRVLPEHRVPLRTTAGRRPVSVQAGMLSCPARATLRAATLERLRHTDWGDEPVLVQIDPADGGDPKERQERNARLLLERFLAERADYLLFLEDDLIFNRHLRKNLLSWPWLTLSCALASLYNPGIIEAGYDLPNRAYLVEAERVFGSQALVISRRTAEFFVRNWDTVPGMQDIKMSRLAGQLRKPIVYHAPSLVQHVAADSTWGGASHQASDFRLDWVAMPQIDAGRVALSKKSERRKMDDRVLV